MQSNQCLAFGYRSTTIMLYNPKVVLLFDIRKNVLLHRIRIHTFQNQRSFIVTLSHMCTEFKSRWPFLMDDLTENSPPPPAKRRGCPTYGFLYCKQQWSVIFEKTQMRHRWTPSHQSFVVCAQRGFWIPPSLPTSSNSLAAGGAATMFNAPCGVRSSVSERKASVRTGRFYVLKILSNGCV